MSELREAIAAAIRQHVTASVTIYEAPLEYEPTHSVEIEGIDEAADAALAAIEARGMVVVPKEPHIGPDYEAGLWSRRNWEALLRDHYAMIAAARTED